MNKSLDLDFDEAIPDGEVVEIPDELKPTDEMIAQFVQNCNDEHSSSSSPTPTVLRSMIKSLIVGGVVVLGVTGVVLLLLSN